MEQQIIRATLVDDDASIRNLIRMLLKRYFGNQIEVVTEANSVESALEAIRTSKPQLLFLDVDLQDGMGFEVLELLEEERKKLHVIFITSHGTKFIHRALRLGAVDYLDKPIEPAEFKAGVERGINKVVESQSLTQQLPPPAKRSSMLAVRHNAGTETIVPMNSILYCKADNNYTQIFLAGKHPIIASKTLKHYEEVLEKYGFVRVSRNLLINPEHCYVKLDKKNVPFIQMPDGSHEYVEPAYQEFVKKELLDIVA